MALVVVLDIKTEAFGALRAKVAYVDRGQHIGAIVSARNLKLFAKNKILAGLKADWLSSSPSELSVLRDVATSLVRQHASELVAKEWGSLYELRELSQLSGTPHHNSPSLWLKRQRRANWEQHQLFGLGLPLTFRRRPIRRREDGLRASPQWPSGPPG